MQSNSVESLLKQPNHKFMKTVEVNSCLLSLKIINSPPAFKKKDHEACNSNYIRHNTCFPESVSEETNEETKQGKKSEKHFGRYSS